MRVGLAILVAAGLAVLLPRLALAFFTFPSADDYCIVVETRRDGFWYMQVHSYLTWTGRYSAVFLESIVSQFDIVDVYPWFAVTTILATLAAIRAAIAAILDHQISRLRVTAIAVVVAAVVIGGLPSTSRLSTGCPERHRISGDSSPTCCGCLCSSARRRPEEDVAGTRGGDGCWSSWQSLPQGSTNRPPGLFWGDLEADESHWINVCVAQYYGFSGVRFRL